MERFHYTTVTSTNDIAKELLKVKNIVVVTADYQTLGRGRIGKAWESEGNKNAILSLGLKKAEVLNTMTLHTTMALGCLAVKSVLEELSKELKIRIKYPNDVYIQEKNQWKKVSGVLVENEFFGTQLKSVIIGIGINVNQTSFSGKVESGTSISAILGEQSVENVIQLLIKQLEKRLLYPAGEIFEEWKNELRVEGKIVKIQEDGSVWRIKKLNENGMLEAENQHGESKFIHNGDTIRYDL